MLAKGITLPVYYIAPFEKSNVTKEEAPLLVNTTMFSYISSASTEPIMATFVETYYESYGEYPSYRAALSYEIVDLVARAIHKANTDDYRKIADTLENIETEPGIFNNMPPKELLPEQTIFIEGVEMDIVNSTPKFILYDTVRG
jgi:ABC-type branched-subunit amino acid transport system substrate-binding protein